MKLHYLLFFFFSPTLLIAQNHPFGEEIHPSVPDYSQEESWSALPFRHDAADVIPKTEDWVNDSLKKIDVFFVHPTTYKKGENWNADIQNKKLNKKVDRKPVHYQASAFNETCRIYAPRYRQAIVDVFFHPSEDGEKALELAYSDVKSAFKYYLENYNKGRPIIIASHSQGTRHARQLLQEFFDGTAIQQQLVAAYIVGFTVEENMYTSLKLCEEPTQTGCYISWMSYRTGYEPEDPYHKETVCVNPLTWTTDTAFVDKAKSLGTVVLNLSNKHENATAAQIRHDDGDYLWVDTKAPIIKLFKILHIMDYNLFWYDIRENVKDRVNAYLDKKDTQ